MFEKVNPQHPDKVADRIAGAIVDLCYMMNDNPKVACEALAGHDHCYLQIETSEKIKLWEVEGIVERITNNEHICVIADIVPQDPHLAQNQRQSVRCGDNGIFKGAPITKEQRTLTDIAATIYKQYPHDGKYVLFEKPAGRDEHGNFQLRKEVIICQSHLPRTEEKQLVEMLNPLYYADGEPGFSTKYTSNVNPLGEWTGGINVDSGATNRKLGSDMGDGVTGGGLHGKDLSKADVSVNIVCHLMAQKYKENVTACCAIGDDEIIFHRSGKREHIPYAEVVNMARKYIADLGGFEKFAEWGLIRPE